MYPSLLSPLHGLVSRKLSDNVQTDRYSSPSLPGPVPPHRSRTHHLQRSRHKAGLVHLFFTRRFIQSFSQEVAGSNECWRFTWVGDADESTDTSVDCREFDDMCFMPIVFTNGSTGSGPDFGWENHNLRDFPFKNDFQRSGGEVQQCDWELPVWLDSGRGVCQVHQVPQVRSHFTLKIILNLNDRNGVPVYYSSFCGSGVNRNNFDTHAVTSGCHKDTTTQVGYDIEVCFCKGNMCNKAEKIGSSSLISSLVFIFSMYIFSVS